MSVKKEIGILIGIWLNLWISFGRMVIFTLILLILVCITLIAKDVDKFPKCLYII